MSSRIKIGLFGFGCVGQGLYHVLNKSTGFKSDIKKIVVKNRNKKRDYAQELISFDKNDILENPEIDVVVELIDDANEAYQIVKTALQKGKHVVTANKKMLALHLAELYELQKQYKVSLLYEGSACGSIPIIRTLEEYFDNEPLQKISGIFNGTTNYILTKTINDKLSYENALKQAQEKGFAESDPTNDVEGFDAKYKAIILALHAFGTIVKPDNLLNIGITGLAENDIQYATEKNYKIKLTPTITLTDNNKLNVLVVPQFIKNNNQLYNVENEFNGVIVEGKFSGEQFLQGRGAGSLPTGAAVLSDISALSHGYKYEFKKHEQGNAPAFTNQIVLNIYMRYNNKEELNLFSFIDIEESYTATNYNYVVGKILLDELIKNKELIKENKLFVALINDKINYYESKNSYKFAENQVLEETL
jgi:homoserine dehydrogenase